MLLPLVVFVALTVSPDPLAVATDFVSKVIQTFPAWEQDTLAQYERPELAAVKRDINRCIGDEVEDDFLQDAIRLERDWGTLVSLDKALQRNEVL